MSKKEDINENEENGGGDDLHSVIHVSGMYQNWFLDYASYVILERAVPYVEDGLKPVQRRILHSMNDLDDGRYNKVANIIGHTMKYHPHGDMSIGDALVALGQKDLLIDTQGNWGNTLTGDRAAAPRYIEARLSKFAVEVVFNAKTTTWLMSYDGRNKEPETLPVKFPLLLAQGVEGIAVGLACKMLPHNFNELCDASVASLRGKKTDILPDFTTAGMADFSNYNDGLRGGKVRVRAKISQLDKKTLVINEIPFGTTTGSLIETIVAANDKGKIKIRKVEDNTAENVEIVIHLVPGISPDKTIDALYAFSDCEVSISPNACIIEDDKPKFIGVNEILKISTQQTLGLLKRELEIEKAELQESYMFASLEKIFIKDEMYIEFKEYSDKPTLFEYLGKRFSKYKKQFIRVITDEDFEKLTQIPMIRITRFDSKKADEKMKALDTRINEIDHHLANMIDYAVEYFKNLKKKYGAGRERKTEIKSFENIVATSVVVANEKLYVNREEGFAGYGLKKDEFVSDCSDIDDIIAFRRDGTMQVSKVADKAFVGKDLIHIAVFKKNDERTVYNMIYRDGKSGSVFMKRFPVTGVTRDKQYDLTKGTKDSQVLYFSANPNGEAEVVEVQLKPMPGLRKVQWDINFAELAVKNRNSQGNVVTKYSVKKIVLKEKGVSTLGARDIWFDDTVQRLNTDKRGAFLGSFGPDDKILTITQSGYYKLTGFDLSTHFDEDMVLHEKWNPNKPVSAIYLDGESKTYFVKRFMIEPTDKKILFISEAEGSHLESVTTEANPIVELKFSKVKDKELPSEKINLAEFIEVKGLKAKGNKLSYSKIKEISLLPPVEVAIDEDVLEEFEESGASPIEALKKAQEPAKEKNIISIDQQINAEIKLPSSEKKKKKKKSKGKDDGEQQITMDLG
ncbi:MAG: DNA gyrase/topoisomerase IV subunit A [Bacteroidetes bacterium]|nr:DNA gyrase/topoisomerase IV subunit A [Bacteroidota bacterium]